MKLCLVVSATLIALVALSGCAPSVSPLYRDYEVRASAAAPDADVHARLRRALAEAGWNETPSHAPNVISTAPRTVSNWGLYRTEVTLDAAPIGDQFVRIYFHPYRYSFVGSRSKVGYLSGGLRRALLRDLNPALERHGFAILGTSRERDEETVEG